MYLIDLWPSPINLIKWGTKNEKPQAECDISVLKLLGFETFPFFWWYRFRKNLVLKKVSVEEISHKRIFSWDVHLESKYVSHKRIFSWDAHLESKYVSHKRIWNAHLESKYVSHKRIRFCEQSVYAKSPLYVIRSSNADVFSLVEMFC